jgi:two-component system cell cycle sensor histidine kinase/response regulator CckA
MEESFRAAEDVVSRYFAERQSDPTRGTIEIFGERYVLVRAASLSVEFFAMVGELFGAGREDEADAFARNILFDLAHAIGKSDAQSFHAKMNLSDPIAKLSAGPVHFAHTGWAFVDIHPESIPSAGEGYFLVYDHPYSFESDAWLQSVRTRSSPACIMNAGYSSGWCEESFGVQLVAAEILCRARGDQHCRFVMAHPRHIEGHIARYTSAHPDFAGLGAYAIPDLFSRKRAEEELQRSHSELERRVEERTAELRTSNARLEEEMNERARVEQVLRQAQRLEAIGRLAGGIAHDFNNLMGIVLAHADMLARKAPPELRLHTAEIHAATARAAALTQQLLTFSRGRAMHEERLDLARVVTALGELVRPILGEDVELETDLAADAGAVQADKGQLEQIVLNLVINARDAMPTGGHLTIRVARMELERELAVVGATLAPGRYVSLSIEDTGSGIHPNALPYVFDPFFTTKPDGLGSGLGLSTVYGIVLQSGGGIVVDSEPGLGTRFTIHLPWVGESGAEPAAPTPAPDPPGHGTILLVEDEDELRDSLAMALQLYGFEVLVAPTPLGALELARDNAERIDVLVTDVVMPELSGPELAERVRAIAPRAQVILVSGYAPEKVLPEGVRESVTLLQKPFLPSQLARVLRELVR